ncbi:MAG: hypothetical protein JSR83_07380 [Proteobacteria bacterium]|nr:hypothetical protein [Pseudomonadota bacterium]
MRIQSKKVINRRFVKTKTSHGGARQGAGRKPDTAEPMHRKNVTLDAKSIVILRRFGNGDLSQGIRDAAAFIESNKECSMNRGKVDLIEKAMMRGSSQTLRKRAAQLQETFNLNVPMPSRPGAAFDLTVEVLQDLLEEVARRSYSTGVKDGATAALDAVLDGKVTFNREEQMLYFQQPKKPITVSARALKGKSTTTDNDVHFDVGPVKLTPAKLGFVD